MHNSISLDGAFSGFEFPAELMELHYRIAAGFGESLRLIGSNTARVSIDLFGGFTPETRADRDKPQKPEGLSYWAIPDSKGSLDGMLHYFRRSEYCRDVIVLVSASTPKSYLHYLEERKYDFRVAGRDRIDLNESLRFLSEKYKPKTILVDAGRGLTNALLNRGLIDEISLLILPMICGTNALNLFGQVERMVSLTLVKSEAYPGGSTWLLYAVRNHQADN
ncbi:MAG: dihydrofolate reductase family protein [Anaerolineales bacterium]